MHIVVQALYTHYWNVCVNFLKKNKQKKIYNENKKKRNFCLTIQRPNHVKPFKSVGVTLKNNRYRYKFEDLPIWTYTIDETTKIIYNNEFSP